MILTHYELNEPIEFKDGIVNVLVIENSGLMTKMIEELLNQSEKGEGGFVLFEKDKSVPISETEIIINPFSADINERSILNKLYAAMKKDALDEELFLSTNTFLSDIEMCLQKIIERQPQELESLPPDLTDLFKALNVRFSVSGSLDERLCDYIDICSEYRKTKLFIFVNLKSFLTESEIVQLYAHSIYTKKAVLMIENQQFQALEYEIVRIIDLTLCEIPILESKDNDIY